MRRSLWLTSRSIDDRCFPSLRTSSERALQNGMYTMYLFECAERAFHHEIGRIALNQFAIDRAPAWRPVKHCTHSRMHCVHSIFRPNATCQSPERFESAAVHSSQLAPNYDSTLESRIIRFILHSLNHFKSVNFQSIFGKNYSSKSNFGPVVWCHDGPSEIRWFQLVSIDFHYSRSRHTRHRLERCIRRKPDD